MYGNPGRLFFWSGLLWHAAVRAYWVSLVVRMTVELGLPGLELVLIGTAMELALLLAEVPTGAMADRFSRKWSVVTGFVVVGVAQIVAGVVSAYPALVASQVLWGVGYTFRSGADTAWVTDELGGPGAVERLLLQRGRWQLAVSVIAIGAGGGLAHLTTLSTAVVAAGVLLCVTGAALAVLMPEHHGPRSRPAAPAPARSADTTVPPVGEGPVGGGPVGVLAIVREGARVTLVHRSLRILVVTMLLAGLASEAVDRLDIRRLDDLGLSARYDEVVVVAVIAATEALLGALVLWWVSRRFDGSRVALGLASILALSAAGIVALGLVGLLPVAMLGLVVQGGLRSAAGPLELAWANAEAPSGIRATVHSFAEQATSVGEIAGGVVLGTVAATTTVPTALACSAALIVLAALSAVRGRPVPVAAVA